MIFCKKKFLKTVNFANLQVGGQKKILGVGGSSNQVCCRGGRIMGRCRGGGIWPWCGGGVPYATIGGRTRMDLTNAFYFFYQDHVSENPKFCDKKKKTTKRYRSVWFCCVKVFLCPQKFQIITRYPLPHLLYRPTGKTRQIHRTHLTTGDRLWSK